MHGDDIGEIRRKTFFRLVHPLSTSGTFHRDENAHFGLLPALRAHWPTLEDSA
jgi:hypothetical protein